MGACRKKPAQPASGSQLDDSIGNTPTTVSWRVWGYEVGLGWRLASSGISLPNNVFSWLLSDFTGPFSRPKKKTLRKRVHHKGPPLYLQQTIWDAANMLQHHPEAITRFCSTQRHANTQNALVPFLRTDSAGADHIAQVRVGTDWAGMAAASGTERCFRVHWAPLCTYAGAT